MNERDEERCLRNKLLLSFIAMVVQSFYSTKERIRISFNTAAIKNRDRMIFFSLVMSVNVSQRQSSTGIATRNEEEDGRKETVKVKV